MKRIFLFSLVFGLVAAGTLYAADGDLMVNGKVGIGTSNPSGKVEICDQGACVKWVGVVGNYGADTYTNSADQTSADNCNSDNINTYACLPEESRACIDRYFTCPPQCEARWGCSQYGDMCYDDNGDYPAIYVNRSVRCYREVNMVSVVTNSFH